MSDPMRPFYKQGDFETASIPSSWRIPQLEAQQANLEEVYPGMSFERPVRRQLPELAHGLVYVPRYLSLVDYLLDTRRSYEELAKRTIHQAELYVGQIAIQPEIDKNPIDPVEGLQASFQLEMGFQHDWNILPMNRGGIHGGYAPVQTVTRCLRNRQYPFALYHMATFLIAVRPKLDPKNHFVYCAADMVSIKGVTSTPKFRLHHNIDLGWGGYLEACPTTGAPVFLL